MFAGLVQAGKYLGQTARLRVGLPEYSSYVAHMEKNHPHEPMLTYEQFFRERQEARFGGKSGFRCC